jgi:hypothetical protein
MTDAEINERIDQIQQEADRISAEARNTLHACRPGHPLGRGQDRTDLFRNAAFTLSMRSSVSSAHVQWLNKMANEFASERTA